MEVSGVISTGSRLIGLEDRLMTLPSKPRYPSHADRYKPRYCCECGTVITKPYRKKYCDRCQLKPCAHCGTLFNAHSCTRGLKYCKRSCYTSQMKRELGSSARNWRGGRVAQHTLIRMRSDYKDWRTAVFERDHYTCQDCGARSRPGRCVYLHAHHLKSFATHPKLRTVVSNGLTLCEPCHHKRHRGRNHGMESS